MAATLSFVESSPSSALEAFMRTQMLADLNGNTGIEMMIKVKMGQNMGLQMIQKCGTITLPGKV